MTDGYHLILAGSLVPADADQRELTKTEPNGTPRFTVGDIPLLLFEELSRHFGIGEDECWKNPENDNHTKRRDLDPAHPHIGFKARAAFRKLQRTNYFELWDGDILDSEKRYGGVSYPLIKISAGVQNAGLWAYGRGNLMAE